jgi:hypothetical protein
MGRDRRAFLRLAAGIGLGAVAAEIYERLYNIPALERRFRSEVNHWMNEYNSAKEMVEKLSERVNISSSEVSRLSGEVNYWKNQYSVAREEVNRLSSTVNTLDELEKESTAAISFYRERMEEAVRRLENTIEKYRVILGDERVSFESSTLKVLGDLKMMQERLQKVLPYFPLIKSLDYNPSKVVNDKIYDLSVSLEVISPLNTLKEVEVSLIPVEYPHLPKEAFPEEWIKTIKLQPKGLEKEMFDITFANLRGGREYLVKAVAKDVADNANSEVRKTPYIREFENIAGYDGILVIASYYPWYTNNAWNVGRSSWDWWAPYPEDRIPLLGKYNSDSQIVISKHIDWATGHGIDAFLISWGFDNWGLYDKGIKMIMENPLIHDIKFAILYEKSGRLKDFLADLNDPDNRQTLRNDFRYLVNTYMKHPSYLHVRGSKLFMIDATWGLRGDVKGTIDQIREDAKSEGVNLYFLSDQVTAFSPHDPDQRRILEAVDGITAYQVFQGPSGFWNTIEYEAFIKRFHQYTRERFLEWKNVADRIGIDFIPTAIPGFHKFIYPDMPQLPRSIEFFRAQLQVAKEFVGKAKMINITTFNEWFENTAVEPSQREGFIYLQALRDSIQGLK